MNQLDTIEILRRIHDLLADESRPNVRKAWALAYAECERLSKEELEAMRGANVVTAATLAGYSQAVDRG